MTKYKCLDCAYSANKKFPKGQCPACDSFNISNLQARDKDKPKTSPTSLGLTVGLWIILGYLIWQQLLS
ncbi:Uncharacterised protein [BD1-7 clade bacterium]|uniref:Rubredoxin-like domain-containing protein n=1 Tax=BD1-7 clade bacterium TaxID=2029982 RepID=A0A5S9QSW2_9GAMM|nr:Uncharacterised protein [BD1-7 clade bacterium]